MRTIWGFPFEDGQKKGAKRRNRIRKKEAREPGGGNVRERTLAKKINLCPIRTASYFSKTGKEK